MSIQSSINQAVQGIMSTIIPMSILKEQGKVGQLKSEQEGLKRENAQWKKENKDLKKEWENIIKYGPEGPQPELVDLFSDNAFSAGNDMASKLATQRVQSEQEKRKAQMETLQKAFKNIGMGGGNV